MSALPAPRVLPCGRSEDRLVGWVADGLVVPPGSHEASCPYCQSALAELAAAWERVRRWTRREVEVPADLVRRVITRVRRLAQSPHHVVTASVKGATTVTSWVISLITAEAAAGVPGVVRVGDGLGERWGFRGAADAVEVEEIGAADVGVSFPVVATFDLPGGDLVAMADRVRVQVIDELRRRASVEASEVDIDVTDLADG